METVKWLPIPGYETYYEVSSGGQVRSVGYMSSKTMHYLPRNRPILLKQETTKDGYKRVVLCKDGCKRHFSVHRLVAMAFLLNPHNLPQVNHKDENPANNKVSNLEWCTGKENCNYGLHRKRIVERQTNNPSRSRPVSQFSLDGSHVADFPSTREAERQTGVKCESITRCCRGKYKHAGGYHWQYYNPWHDLNPIDDG